MSTAKFKNIDLNKTRVRLLVGYDGTDFCGWQIQNQGGKPSVQETIEKALAQMLREEVTVVGSGRTDAGVHALSQNLHFDTSREFSPQGRDIDFVRGLGAHLPSTIVVKKAWVAPAEYHSLFSAQQKTYRYLVWNAPVPSVTMGRFTHWIRKPLDVDFLNSCSAHLVGTHDYKSFQTAGTEILSTVRTLTRARWRRLNPQLIEFSVTGTGFLKQMVRNIVGTQLLFMRKNLPPDSMADILAACDRRAAGPTAPPEGLFLAKVVYPEDIENQCRPLYGTSEFDR